MMFNCVGLSIVALLLVIGAAAEERAEYDYYKYHPMVEITDWMTQIAKDNPDIVKIIDYGKTYELRTISLLKIGVDTGEKKKAVWMDCGIHAREWIAPAFCQYFVRQILDAYKKDSKMEEMMKNIDFYVTPVLNIDGYIYTWINESTRQWRKNRSPGPPGCECYGTDLNRNYDANWGTVGVSFNCCSILYCGRQVQSEPETQAVTYFIGTRKEDFLCFFNIHSYGQLLLFPYGHPDFTATNYEELMAVGLAAADAIKKVHGMDYTVGASADVLYPMSGSSKDWSQMQGIPYSFIFELRDNGTYEFELPEDQIKPACEEAYAGALHIITHAHDKTFNSAVETTAATLWTVMAAISLTNLI
ncbi:carboxypeptidase O-like [Cheilinus undulatus]|uniref:carboxypeptidase O-like n=1 Tax=Cheilinus undulatus TaxID=241271 RepID=UPI001BD4E79E|nr:carboxypeptidase O-like [Cheilinus undulatus]